MKPTFQTTLMKVVMCVIALSTCMMAQSTRARSSKVVHSSGAFAYLYSQSVSGSQVWLYTSHEDHPGTPATFLEFDIFTSHPDGSFTDIFGIGDVPEDSLTGNSAKNLTLNVDTSQVSAFQTTTCESNGVCQPGPVGLVHLDFQTNGDYTYKTVSENHQVFFQEAQRSHYDYDSASSLADGSILGNSVSNGSGEIGTNRSTTITLTRNH